MLLNVSKRASNVLWWVAVVSMAGYVTAWVAGVRGDWWFLPLVALLAAAVAFKVPDDDDE